MPNKSDQNDATPSIPQDDAVLLVEMMAQIATHPGDHLDKKNLLLDRLCQLIKAERWSWAFNTFDKQGGARHAGTLQGGFTLEQAENLAACAHHPVSNRTYAPTYQRIFRERIPITVRLEDHPGYDEWRQSEAAQLAAQAGIGTFVSSVCAVNDTASSSVTLFRSPGQPTFTQRERDMLHIIMRGVSWLHREGWPDDCQVESTVELPPSHMVVLTLLIKGYSRNQIAEARGLSINTVNAYTQRIFTHFDVRSQPELMRQFLHGQTLTDTNHA